MTFTCRRCGACLHPHKRARRIECRCGSVWNPQTSEPIDTSAEFDHEPAEAR